MMKTLNKAQLAMLTAIAVSSIPFQTGVLAAEIEEIVITGRSIEQTIPQELARYGNRVEVITSEEIERRGFDDIAQTLQMMVPGLHIRPKNGQFDYFDASLQGSRSSEILWLIDGVRITNRLYNGTSPLDTIPAHMVERIEVLKGGQGIFYGTQSVGGVVNVVTKSFQNETNGSIGIGFNSNNGYSVNGYMRGGNNQHQFVLYASKDDADGYQPYRDADIQLSSTDRDRSYDVNMGGIKYAYQVNDNASLSLQYQRTENELDFARPYLNFNTVNEREEDILTIKYDWQVNDYFGLFVKAYRHNWDTLYTRIYNTLDATGNVTGALTTINNNTYWGYEDHGANAMAKFNFDNGFEYVVGLDHQNFSGTDDVWRIGDQEEEVNAVFGQIRTTEELMENTALALGVRRNEASNINSSTVWNLSGKHNFTAMFYIRGNAGTSFRLPDAEALFLNEYYDADNDGVPDGGWFAIGNPNLKPEKSENINIALGGLINNLSYELIGFSRDITNYIDSYVPLTIAGVVGESFINSNDQVEVDGFEFVASYPLNDQWNTNFSYNNTSSELNGDGVQLTGIPESEVKIRLDFTSISMPYGLSFALNHVGDLNARRGEKRGNYTVMDLSGYYNLGSEEQHQFVFRIENLADKEYASRVDRGTLDATGTSYLYDNLGMSRTFHASYNYRF
jgi:vitamin B12 transporter